MLPLYFSFNAKLDIRTPTAPPSGSGLVSPSDCDSGSWFLVLILVQVLVWNTLIVSYFRVLFGVRFRGPALGSG